MTPTIEDRHALGLRVGTVIRVDPHLGAGDPPFRLWIDFGPPGTHQSSAKITDRCSARDLIGRQVVAVTGFDPIRVGGFRSDVLILGALDASGVVLLAPDAAVPAGTEIA